MLRILSAAFTALFIAGCAIGPSLPEPPVKASQADFEYKLSPGDQIEVNVWRNPEVSTKVPIRPDGRVTIPLIEDLQASGKTPAALAREIEQGLGKYIREPSVSVIVLQVADSMRDQVRVAGEVNRPIAIQYRPRMTLLDAMMAANGLTKLAAGNRAVLVRPAEGNKQYSIRVKDLLGRADPTANVELLPGDQITVPESKF